MISPSLAPLCSLTARQVAALHWLYKEGPSFLLYAKYQDAISELMELQFADFTSQSSIVIEISPTGVEWLNAAELTGGGE